MNKTQLQYAVNRLRGAANAKVSELKTAKPAKVFDVEALVAGIKNGKIKPKQRTIGQEVLHYTDVGNIFVLPETEEDKPDPAFEKAKVALWAEVTRIEDQLYLGDVKVALALIEAFETKKF